MNIPARCNGVYTRRGFILSYYTTVPFPPCHPRDLLIPILDTALDIPYISIRVIIAFERASPKPRRSSTYPRIIAKLLGLICYYLRIFQSAYFVSTILCVRNYTLTNVKFIHCSNFLYLRQYIIYILYI